MVFNPKRRSCAAAGIIERFDNHVLILLPHDDTDGPRLWRFPRGLAQPDEAPEAAMRRIANEQLALDVEIVVGQPPIVGQLDGREVEWRYFFCGLIHGEPRPAQPAEVRWVSKAHLREYDFDPPSQLVVNWLLES